VGETGAPIRRIVSRLPEFRGRPIRIDVRPVLLVSGGRLVHSGARGAPVHAASDILGRRILLEEELYGRAGELARVLTHELFHFVWARMRNACRWSYEAVLEREIRLRGKGELGWPAEEKKQRLERRDVEDRTRRWRDYVCESFCDTAAWYFTGGSDGETLLKPRFQAWRAAWFRNFAPAGRRIPI